MRPARHRLLAAAASIGLAATTACAAEAMYPLVEPGYRIEFPRDDGAHPQFRTEWWYVTGWLQRANEPLGFQITFFRRRPGTQEDNPSQFAAKQVLFAHAAISDPRRSRLLRAEKAARAGFGLAYARERDLAVAIDDWSLQREPSGSYRSRASSDAFSFDLSFEPTQKPLLHGDGGFSRKSPQDASASSYYYSVPHLRVTGRITVEGQTHVVQGEAWLDHEWFTSFLDEATQGWDWLGANLDDGGAIMASRMRNSQGVQRWAFATWRSNDGVVRTFAPAEISWTAERRWRSPRTGVEYPIEWTLRVAERTVRLRALMDDQENDTRATTGTLYWEGAASVLDERSQRIGRGYLELTGYGERLGM